MATIPFATRLRELEALEEVQREELRWEEEQRRSSARIAFLRRSKAVHQQLGAAARKREAAAAHSDRTRRRRADALVAEEQRGRQALLQSEAARHESIVKALDLGVREALFDAAYMRHQQDKYLAKTIEAIVKSEGRDRAAALASERYERQVLVQRHDAGSLKLQRAAALAKVAAEKSARHDKTRGQQQQLNRSATASAAPSPLGASPPPSPSAEAPAGSSRGGASYRQSRTNSSSISRQRSQQQQQLQQTKSKISTCHDADTIARMLYTAEAHEENRREGIFIDEDRAWAGLGRFFDFILEREARYGSADFDQTERLRVAARRIEVLRRREAAEREAVSNLEAAALAAIYRRWARAEADSDKLLAAEERRQTGYGARMQHRLDRVAAQQKGLAERDRAVIADLLSAVAEAAVEGSPNGATSGSGPTLDGQTSSPASSSRRARGGNVAAPSGSTADGRARQQIVSAEEKARAAIARDEGKAAHATRAQVASLRREAADEREQSQIADRMQRAHGKSAAAHKRALGKIEAEQLARAEAQGRVRVNQDLVDFHSSMAAALRAAGRMAALLPGVVSEEERLRATVASHEKGLREGYAKALKMGLGPKTKPAPPPLPPPPISFEAAQRLYAKHRAAHGLGGNGTSPYASRKENSNTGRSGSGRSSVRSNSNNNSAAVTPHKPPPRVSGGRAAAAPSPSAARSGRYAAAAPPPRQQAAEEDRRAADEADHAKRREGGAADEAGRSSLGSSSRPTADGEPAAAKEEGAAAPTPAPLPASAMEGHAATEEEHTDAAGTEEPNDVKSDPSPVAEDGKEEEEEGAPPPPPADSEASHSRCSNSSGTSRSRSSSRGRQSSSRSRSASSSSASSRHSDVNAGEGKDAGDKEKAEGSHRMAPPAKDGNVGGAAEDRSSNSSRPTSSKHSRASSRAPSAHSSRPASSSSASSGSGRSVARSGSGDKDEETKKDAAEEDEKGGKNASAAGEEAADRASESEKASARSSSRAASSRASSAASSH